MIDYNEADPNDYLTLRQLTDDLREKVDLLNAAIMSLSEITKILRNEVASHGDFIKDTLSWDNKLLRLLSVAPIYQRTVDTYYDCEARVKCLKNEKEVLEEQVKSHKKILDVLPK